MGPPLTTDSNKRMDVSYILRGSWRASVDRRIGLKSGRHDKYIVQSLDVWGNSKDGYEINQAFNAGWINVPESASDRDILRLLRDQGFLTDWTKGNVKLDDINGMGEHINIVNRKNGEPYIAIEKECKE